MSPLWSKPSKMAWFHSEKMLESLPCPIQFTHSPLFPLFPPPPTCWLHLPQLLYLLAAAPPVSLLYFKQDSHTFVCNTVPDAYNVGFHSNVTFSVRYSCYWLISSNIPHLQSPLCCFIFLHHIVTTSHILHHLTTYTSLLECSLYEVSDAHLLLFHGGSPF